MFVDNNFEGFHKYIYIQSLIISTRANKPSKTRLIQLKHIKYSKKQKTTNPTENLISEFNFEYLLSTKFNSILFFLFFF